LKETRTAKNVIRNHVPENGDTWREFTFLKLTKDAHRLKTINSIGYRPLETFRVPYEAPLPNLPYTVLPKPYQAGSVQLPIEDTEYYPLFDDSMSICVAFSILINSWWTWLVSPCQWTVVYRGTFLTNVQCRSSTFSMAWIEIQYDLNFVISISHFKWAFEIILRQFGRGQESRRNEK
jgi:hypothetical protein